MRAQHCLLRVAKVTEVKNIEMHGGDGVRTSVSCVPPLSPKLATAQKRSPSTRRLNSISVNGMNDCFRVHFPESQINHE